MRLCATLTIRGSHMSSQTVVIIGIIVYFVYLIPLFGVFSKTREPGWAAFIPIWNLLVLLKIVGRPWWWILLFIIPCGGHRRCDRRLVRPLQELRPQGGVHR